MIFYAQRISYALLMILRQLLVGWCDVAEEYSRIFEKKTTAWFFQRTFLWKVYQFLYKIKFKILRKLSIIGPLLKEC